MAKVTKMKGNKKPQTRNQALLRTAKTTKGITVETFNNLQALQHEIKEMEALLATAKERLEVEERQMIALLDLGAYVPPEAPAFYKETSYRRNVKWQQVVVERLGLKVANMVREAWPKDKYERIRFGLPPRSKGAKEIKMYERGR